jgi:hypothetical protein
MAHGITMSMTGRTLACLALLLASSAVVHARMRVPATVADMARSAGRVFRGHCATRAVSTIEVAGARLPVTTYTFRVGEHLKGGGGRTVTFRQVGTPEGGPRDLGRLVGLPVYAPGTEYVLFLLPPGRAGTTSPAGAAEGAFLVSGDQVVSLRGAAERPSPEPPTAPAARAAAAPAAAPSPAGAEELSYEALRRAVLDAVRP